MPSARGVLRFIHWLTASFGLPLTDMTNRNCPTRSHAGPSDHTRCFGWTARWPPTIGGAVGARAGLEAPRKNGRFSEMTSGLPKGPHGTGFRCLEIHSEKFSPEC